MKFKDIQTKAIHAGEASVRATGAVAPPIYQSATFTYTGEDSYHDLRYIRLNNTPSHIALQEKIATLCGGERCVVTTSGMAAISTALLAFLEAGDHALFQDCLYGGTHGLLADLHATGVEMTSIDGGEPEGWDAHLRENTRVIYVEAMTNPMLRVADLRAVVAFAKRHGLVSMVDNTFASPVNFNPLEMGFDIEIHSATKYLNGHSDIVAGCVVGASDRIDAVLHKLNHLGGCLDPHACFLLHRGIKTLPLRVGYQNQSASSLASFLDAHPGGERVVYPGLEHHPDHSRAIQLFRGFGGMISFCAHSDVAAADRVVSALELPACAPSLGGVESLVTRPATTTHSGMTPEERSAMGIEDRLIRVSVGIESTDDLCADFDRALEKL